MIDEAGFIADWFFLALSGGGIGALLLMVGHGYTKQKQ